MPRTHGYSDKGKRCYGLHNWGAKGRTNLIGAMIGKALLTVILLSGTVNTQVFTSWVKDDLLPKLPPKSVIVMDNATFHKGKEMKLSIEGAGHTLIYLPTYSPDLNPIEHKWAESKHIRRKFNCSIDDLFRYYIT